MKPKVRKSSTRSRKSSFRRCYCCEKRFKNAQAVRAHQPHCPVRRLKAQAQGIPADEPPESFLKARDHESHRRGPYSQENKLLLIDTHESIKALLQSMEFIVVSAHFFFQGCFINVKENVPPEKWKKLSDELDSIERDIEQMVGSLRLDRTLLFEVYHRLSGVRDAWLQYREHDRIQQMQRRTSECVGGRDDGTSQPENERMIADDRALLDDVMGKIKRLLVAAR
jgi:hypothetical protein